MDLTHHREPRGPALAELGTGRVLSSLPARQGQAAPVRGKACAPPQQAASTELGSKQGTLGPGRHSPLERQTEGEPMALCLCRAKTRRRWLQNQEDLFVAEQTGQSWDLAVTAPEQKALWRGEGRNRGGCVAPPALAPFPHAHMQGEASDTHPALPDSCSPTGRCVPGSRRCPNITTPPARFCPCHQPPPTH